MKHLGLAPKRPKIAVFDFTSCEGCELQLANKEETLVDFLSAVEVVSFREISSAAGEDYDVALVEGCVSRADEVPRLKSVRKRAKVLVAFGSCACFGGVCRLKNAGDAGEASREVYGAKGRETSPVRAVKEVVDVDLELPGCPVSKAEVERLVQHLAFDVPFERPVYPVCVECKQSFTTCMFERGQLCLGSITRAGCDAPCPAGGLGCWGCRGPSADANLGEFVRLARDGGYSDREIDERLSFFSAFEGVR